MKKKAIKTWESKREFKEEVYLFANKVKVKVKQITIRPMTRKWASCSTNGYFTFNVELLGMDRSLGEYVILHELLHYHVSNHGKLWKSLMNVHMPDHENRKNRLNKI
ncbi:MAG: M48 family metallopeptidase [Patescibacteria group bacterium]|nr:M48 family metallopeptidase [Patescibacteria group bacterium]MDE2218315.1 M48 family metallopeptidase [Patescibacteria group bacterium]